MEQWWLRFDKSDWHSASRAAVRTLIASYYYMYISAIWHSCTFMQHVVIVLLYNTRKEDKNLMICTHLMSLPRDTNLNTCLADAIQMNDC